MNNANKWILDPITGEQWALFAQTFDSYKLSESEQAYTLLRANGMDGISALKTVLQAHNISKTGEQLTELADRLDHTPKIIQAMSWLTTTGVEKGWIDPRKYSYTAQQSHTDLNAAVSLIMDASKQHMTAGMATALINAIQERNRLTQNITADNTPTPTVIIEGAENLE